MARPKNLEQTRDRERAILEAAITLFAERGAWATPTSAISKAAGVAEGTLFRYFATKDALLNALYRALKAELMEPGLLQEAAGGRSLQSLDLYTVLRTGWARHVRWALENPARHAVLGQLRVSPSVTAETREDVSRPFAFFATLSEDAMARGVIRRQSFEFFATQFMGLADATVAYLESRPELSATERETLLEEGFLTFWQGIALPSSTSSTSSASP